MHNSYEDQPIDRTFGGSHDETELFPQASANQNDASMPQKPVHANRRRFISLLAVGTVGVVTAVTVGGVSFAREADGHFPWEHDDDGSTTERNPDGDEGGKGRKHPRPHKTPTPSPKQTPTPQPTTAPRPTPTTAPQPTATSAPTGTVVGKTSQATNTAVAFTNPADGQASWLVHMSNGNFVAVEQACTHAGVAVKYNASTGQFNCPAHGAIFNADGTNPQAPATKPLPPVHITVNANGTVTTP